MGRERYAARWCGIAAIVLVGGASAGWAVVAPGATPRSVDDRVLLRDADGSVSLVDPETGAAVYEVAGAVVAPDRSTLLTADPAGDGDTVVRSLDPQTGDATGETTVSGRLEVRTVSPDGDAVALLPPRTVEGLYVPEPRETTALTVAYTDARPAQVFSLAGNFEPEAFALDESVLFLLEFTPPLAPVDYRVRQLDLATGVVGDVQSPDVDLDPTMRGTARAQVLHPDGTFLSTVYTIGSDLEPAHSVDAAGEHTSHRAFVHVIDLVHSTATCVFLPSPIGDVDEADIGIGASPDGAHVYVADPTTSTVVRIDTAALAVDQVVPVPQLRPTGAQAVVAVAPDGPVFTAVGSTVLQLDASTLAATAVWGNQRDVTGLAVSADGTQLRVAGGGQVALVDLATGQEVGTLRAPGGGNVDLLGPPAGSTSQFPLECAC
jgi:YVTN family beta-propeller protein